MNKTVVILFTFLLLFPDTPYLNAAQAGGGAYSSTQATNPSAEGEAQLSTPGADPSGHNNHPKKRKRKKGKTPLKSEAEMKLDIAKKRLDLAIIALTKTQRALDTAHDDYQTADNALREDLVSFENTIDRLKNTTRRVKTELYDRHDQAGALKSLRDAEAEEAYDRQIAQMRAISHNENLSRTYTIITDGLRTNTDILEANEAKDEASLKLRIAQSTQEECMRLYINALSQHNAALEEFTKAQEEFNKAQEEAMRQQEAIRTILKQFFSNQKTQTEISKP